MPMDGPTSVRMKQEALDDVAFPEPIPADPIDLRVDFSRDDVIMEDDVPEPLTTAEQVYKANQGSSPPKMLKKPGPRQSAVSAHINPVDIVNAILNSPVSLSAGQIIAISAPVANALIDMMKLKNASRPGQAAAHTISVSENLASISELLSAAVTPTTPVINPTHIVGATFITKDRQRLIQIQIEINGKTCTAIVDTGSMLNVVSRGVWRNYMSHISMDITRHINMGDANGGQAQLRGFLKDVLIAVGGVDSRANFWVGDKVPFEILLGRPWQRGNYVSIDERRDGTYLVFRDPDSGENRHELLVDEGDIVPEFSANFAPFQSMPGSFMMTVIDSPHSAIQPQEVESDIEMLLDEPPMLNEQHNLEREIFGSDSDSQDSDGEITSPYVQPPCTPLESNGGALIPFTRSPLCSSCKVLLDTKIFEQVDDLGFNWSQLFYNANAPAEAENIGRGNKGLKSQSLSSHILYTGLQNIKSAETCGLQNLPCDFSWSPARLLASSSDLSDPATSLNTLPLASPSHKSKIRRFLLFHPEVLWLAKQNSLTEAAAVQGVSDLVHAHQLAFEVHDNSLGSTGPYQLKDASKLAAQPNHARSEQPSDRADGSVDHHVCCDEQTTSIALINHSLPLVTHRNPPVYHHLVCPTDIVILAPLTPSPFCEPEFDSTMSLSMEFPPAHDEESIKSDSTHSPHIGDLFQVSDNEPRTILEPLGAASNKTDPKFDAESPAVAPQTIATQPAVQDVEPNSTSGRPWAPLVASVNFTRPTFENSNWIARLKQSLRHAFWMSSTFSLLQPNLSYNLIKADEVRISSEREVTFAEYYWSVRRKSRFPLEFIMAFHVQHTWEVANELPTTDSPGLNLVLRHRNLTEVPAELSHLHSHPDELAPQDFALLFRYMTEFFSAFRTSPIVIDILRSSDATPLHLMVTPLTANTNLGKNDPATRVLGAIRSEIDAVLSGLVGCFPSHHPVVVAFKTAQRAQRRFNLDNELPPTFCDNRCRTEKLIS
ncbi:hypothetical protein C8F04DRAFT_1190632 [Mycena alexandri]|uniref:Peptidase A2 domain-containing protein n=1 Tax=Mycena alexandri TaxID=1745969 RepID=A0AAD6SEZ6_9AGAR|nr:hypothetical protein C8F04DRAFT_1190632 [Mycena alexandri]